MSMEYQHSPAASNSRFELCLVIAALGLLLVFAFIFSMTYLEWVETPHSAARPLSRRFSVMLLVIGVITVPWLLWGPVKRYGANGRSAWVLVARPQRILQTGHPLGILEVLWPPLQPLTSVTERLAYLVCLVAPLCLLFGLADQLHNSSRNWSLAHSSRLATLVAAVFFVIFRAKFYAWQMRYYVRHRCCIPVFPSIFVAPRTDAARASLAPRPPTARGVTSLVQAFRDRFGSKRYEVVLVFKSAALGKEWFSVIRTLFESGYWPFRAPWPIRFTDLRTGESRVRAPEDKELMEFSEALQTYRLGFMDVNQQTTLVELYRDAEFDFLVLHVPESIFHQDGMVVTMRWHNELDKLGLYTILAGHALAATAVEVRDMDPDAPFGYRIRGLEFSSPGGATLAQFSGREAD